MSEQKQDEVLYSQSQWMRPLQTTQLGNGVTPRKLSDAYATRYTPNEPDASEAAYAAQAQAARRRRHGAAPAQPQQPAGAIATPEPRPEPEARPDAVLYSSTAGIPPSAFADSEPGEGAAATGRRRRRMEQRREENPPLPQLQPSITFDEDTLRRKGEAKRQQAQPSHHEEEAFEPAQQPMPGAAQPSMQEDPFHRQDSLRSRANAIHAAQSSQERQAAFTTNPYAASARPHRPAALREKAEAAKTGVKQKLSLFSRKNPTGDDGAEAPLLVNSTNKPFGLKDGLSWTLTRSDKKPPKREEPAVPDLMDSSRMPTPVPVQTIDIPKTKRSTRWLTLLVALMLLVAAASYLFLSGLGEDLVQRATALYQAVTNRTIQTGNMSVVPETAAVPTTLIVTLSTDSTIADLRLLDDEGNVLPADISCAASGNDCLWSARVVMEQPYSGFIRAQLLDMRGKWAFGSSSRYVNIN